jgi:hypothetical protein
MPTATLNSRKLLNAVDKLNQEELDSFVRQVLQLRASKLAPTLSATETRLFTQINGALPEELRKRKLALTRKRKNLTLTKAEHEELLRLTEAAEKLDVKRVSALTKLAKLRQVSLRELMKDLGIKPPPIDG